MSYTSKYTGAEIDSLLSSIGGINATKKVLWEGSITNAGDMATLSESMENYEYLVVESKYITDPSSNMVRQYPATILSVSQILDSYAEGGIICGPSYTNISSGGQVSIFFKSTGVNNLGIYTSITSNNNNSVEMTKVVGIKFAQSSLAGGSASNPIGSILPVMGTEAPQDYLVCDGRELQISEYKELADYFEKQFGDNGYFGGDGINTFAIPDLRNEFLRGYHCNGEKQLSDEIGAHQEPTYHPRPVSGDGNQPWMPVNMNGSTYAINEDTREGESTKRINWERTLVTGTMQAPYITSRPTNVAVLFCIKYTETKTQHTVTTREYGCYNIGKPANTSDNAEFPITALEENIGINENGRIVLKANKAYLVKITCRQITFTGVGLAAIKLVKSDNTEIARLINLYPVTHSATVTGDGIERIVKFTEDTEIKLTVQEWTSVRDVYDLTLTIIEI